MTDAPPSTVVEPGAENPRERANPRLQRLGEQHMLTLVDGRRHRALATTPSRRSRRLSSTPESLTLLTGTLSAQLVEVLAEAKKVRMERTWRDVARTEAAIRGLRGSGAPRWCFTEAP